MDIDIVGYRRFLLGGRRGRRCLNNDGHRQCLGWWSLTRTVSRKSTEIRHHVASLPAGKGRVTGASNIEAEVQIRTLPCSILCITTCFSSGCRSALVSYVRMLTCHIHAFLNLCYSKKSMDSDSLLERSSTSAI